ncbi:MULTISPECIES: ATP-binding protein [Acidobacterium]|uniref:ATPase, AAA family n=1 Tax=Acidobacterium capsulatum (strain ATCC 51196 / DSM 11244 / BCRC 80197 / JCM 7670 / NBRC 15755 / NCIMB 13165 / 161) TaxID=240015 RepID=C1F9K6_ACIC5|nr:MULTISPECIES: ATP-binding protein [Acidobacterium]ACO33843.1 ATPase, AAA family [Acidobacterium capsulatum ATCC 51196]HCT62214.1 transcriptional regulator [Acidobacterium sp.]
MIDQDKVLELCRDLESDHVERTTTTRDTDKFAKAVTAFSNDLPGHGFSGYLLVGVKDDGALSGLTVTDELLRTLGSLRDDGNILPAPAINVAKFSFPEGDVAVVEVIPSDLPPVRYKGQVWIRTGPRKGVANEQEERILTERRIAHARTFDAQPARDSSIEDLSIDLFRSNYLTQAVAREIIQENHRSIEHQLASLRFYDQKRMCPTNAGILLFGKNPLQHLPGAYIQFLRVQGTTLNDEILTERSISGDLLTVLRELDLLIKIYLDQKPFSISPLREEMIVSYPEVALREFLMNAVLHRSYESTAPIRFYWFEDHIEIQNPGGLYGEATRENFPQQNSYRNPIIAEAMKTLGFVNRFGRGVIRAKDVLAKNGNREPDFTFDPNYVGVTVWAKP